MSTPIERIAGYACEVDEEQWRELVKVADYVGLLVGEYSRDNGTDSRYRVACIQSNYLILGHGILNNESDIGYPDFLAKLKGEVKWEPKNGEEVEVLSNLEWVKANYIGKNGHYFVVDRIDLDEYKEYMPTEIRQADLRPTITRAEAEQVLGKRIVD